MPIFSRLIFTVVRWNARRGLRDSAEPARQKQNQEAQRDEKFERKEKARREDCSEKPMVTGTCAGRGTFSLPKIICRIKGELDLVGYDGETIAFVEIRTRTVREDISGLPELSVSHPKQSVLVRTAQRRTVI
jgi:hypothetical protein